MKNLVRFITLNLFLLVYLYGIGNSMIPTIGDELVYMNIADKTLASGNWLPLQTEQGLENTKPPMLFWQGMWSTKDINRPDYFNYRWPTFLVTVLIVLMLIHYGRKIFGGFSYGISASLFYLSFFSTFQYGRHFLMQAHETLFMSWPLLRFIAHRNLSWSTALFAGLCFGLASLYKSFIFSFLGVGILFVLILIDNEFKIDFKSLLKVLLKLTVSLLFSLLVFSIWFLLDTEPESIWSNFILRENWGKISGSYWEGLKNYPITNIWLGIFSNAGFLAPLVLALFLNFRKNKPDIFEKMLIGIIICYLVFFTIPSQRQSNYVIASMVPVALLLSNRVTKLSGVLKRLMFTAYGMVSFLALIVVIWYHYAGESVHSEWLPFLLIMNSFWCFIHFIFAGRTGAGRIALVTATFYMSINLFVKPFSKPWGIEEVLSWKEKTIYVPTNFRNKEKRYHYMMPGIEVKPYDSFSELSEQALKLVEEGEFVAIVHREKDWPEKNKLKVYDQRPYLFERQSNQELQNIIFNGKFGQLFGYLSIVKKRG